jgi:hypothetical protein
MSYVIRDEDGEVIRIVGRQEEAQAICMLRSGWSFKCVRKAKVKPTYQFEEALF